MLTLVCFFCIVLSKHTDRILCFQKPSQPGSISSAPSNSQPQLHNEAGGTALPNALKQILEPLQQNKMGPPRMQGPAMGPGMGAGLLGAGK